MIGLIKRTLLEHRQLREARWREFAPSGCPCHPYEGHAIFRPEWANDCAPGLLDKAMSLIRGVRLLSWVRDDRPRQMYWLR